MIEKRTIKRLEKQALVSYDVIRNSSGDSQDGMARTLDVSPAGMHLELTRSLESGDELMVTACIDGKMVTVLGKVVWINENQPYDQAGVQVNQNKGEFDTWAHLLTPND